MKKSQQEKMYNYQVDPRAHGFINRVAPGLFQGVSLLNMSDAISSEEVNFAAKRFWAACAGAACGHLSVGRPVARGRLPM